MNGYHIVKTKDKHVEIENTEDSLFGIIEDDPAERAVLSLKSKLCSMIRILATKSELSQYQLASILQTPQPRVSNLLSGKIHKFSIDFLLKSLHRLDHPMIISYDPVDDQRPLRMYILKHDETNSEDGE